MLQIGMHDLRKSTPVDFCDLEIDTNLRSLLSCTAAFLPHLLAQPSARIVNVTDRNARPKEVHSGRLLRSRDRHEPSLATFLHGSVSAPPSRPAERPDRECYRSECTT